MADRPDESMRMVQSLEGQENVVAVELGFAPQLADDILLLTIEMCLGELPLIVSLAAPRGMMTTDEGNFTTGRLSGPALFPQSLLTVRDVVQANIPVIGAVGVASRENANAMLSVGALAVQVDASLWKGDPVF